MLKEDGKIECLKFGHKSVCLNNGSINVQAAEYGDLEYLKYAH